MEQQNTFLTEIADNGYAGITPIGTPSSWSFKVYGEAKIVSVDDAACIDTELAINGSNFSHYPRDLNAVTEVIFCEGTDCGSPNVKSSTAITYIDEQNSTVTVP